MAVCAQKFAGFTGLQRVGISSARQSRSRCWSIDNSLEEERDWHTQNLAEFIQTAGADTVFSLFVFVHLLKRKSPRPTPAVAGLFPRRSAALAHAMRHADRLLQKFCLAPAPLAP